MPEDWWTSSLARLSTLEHKQMDDFFISGASRVDGRSTCTNRQRDRSVFFPASSVPLTQLARVKLSVEAPDVLFLQLETTSKCLIENPLFHARPC